MEALLTVSRRKRDRHARTAPVSDGPEMFAASAAARKSVGYVRRITIRYPGATTAPYTSRLELEQAATVPRMQCYRVMNERGKLLDGAKDYGEKVVGREKAEELMRCMLRLDAMDTTMLHAQRQGRIPFYMTTYGEEAAVIGSAASLDERDTVFAQYREHGLLLYRGLGYDFFANQCCGNELDPASGRQMPMHYGSVEKYYHTVSSPLTTQLPHAVGAAYALKVQQSEQIVAVFFGDGAASEGDFAVAMNFGATLDTGLLFICRNNGFAISTPTDKQYRGDGIAGRGVGYGVCTVRVDGNDIWAVMQAVAESRKFALNNSQPVLLELMTYRSSHHSTSDDSSRYRDPDEMSTYVEKASPIDRLRYYLRIRDWWVSSEEERAFVEAERAKVVAALNLAESLPKASPMSMFEGVYSRQTLALREQQKELQGHLQT